MTLQIKYLGSRNNPLKFETEIKEEEIKNFLTLILAGEDKREVTTGWEADYMYYLITLGTYGDDFRGVISIRTTSEDVMRKIRNDVMAFHNKPIYGWEE